MTDYTTKLGNNKLTVKKEEVEYKVSLSRVGPQGSQGLSVTRAYFDSDNHLKFEISDGTGAVVNILDAGDIDTNFDINDLEMFNIEGIQDGDGLRYDNSTNTFTSHSFSTSSLADVDNTNKSDGSVLVYSGTSSKYVATNNLNNANTTITGGSF